MAVSPTVDEVQHAVMQAWITACITASPPPAVLDSLVFFHPQHGFTPIAIVDVHGENFYRCGRYTVRTVHHQTPLARQMSDCRIGECISHGGAPILLVARDGGPLADPDTCRATISLAPEIARRAEAQAALQENLSSMLSACMEDLQCDIRMFGARPDFLEAADAAVLHRDSLVDLELRLSHIRLQHTVRSLAHLEECIVAEADATRLLHDDVRTTIEQIDGQMKPYRNAMACATVTDDSQDFHSYRRRAEDAYIEALRNPQVVTIQSVVDELTLAKSQILQGDFDAFCVRRQLYALKHNASHTAIQPGASAHWTPLLAEIGAEIDRLRVAIKQPAATRFETAAKGVGATTDIHS